MKTGKALTVKEGYGFDVKSKLDGNGKNFDGLNGNGFDVKRGLDLTA